MVNPTIVNRFFTVVAYIFLIAGVVGFFYFFITYLIDTDLDYNFFLSLISVILGFALFVIYKRVADLGFNRFISQLSTLNTEPTTYIRGNGEKKNESEEETNK